MLTTETSRREKMSHTHTHLRIQCVNCLMFGVCVSFIPFSIQIRLVFLELGHFSHPNRRRHTSRSIPRFLELREDSKDFTLPSAQLPQTSSPPQSWGCCSPELYAVMIALFLNSGENSLQIVFHSLSFYLSLR